MTRLKLNFLGCFSLFSLVPDQACKIRLLQLALKKTLTFRLILEYVWEVSGRFGGGLGVFVDNLLGGCWDMLGKFLVGV